MTTLVTNAPEHWPPGTVRALDVWLGEMTIPLANCIANGLKARGVADARAVFALRWLADDGIVAPSFVIAEGSRLTAVYAYPYVSPSYAADFAWERAALERAGMVSPVFYAPSSIPGAAPARESTNFVAHSTRRIHSRRLRRGPFALWWPNASTTDPRTDLGFKYLARAFRALDGLQEKYAIMLSVSSGNPTWVSKKYGQLPRFEVRRPAMLPNDIEGCLISSSRRGIRFAFHVASTPFAFRDHFLRLFAEDAERLRADSIARGHSLGDGTPGAPLQWWMAVEAAVKHDPGRAKALLAVRRGLTAILA